MTDDAAYDIVSLIDSAYSPAQTRASAILARLPANFHPDDCLVVDEGTSPGLYHALAILLSGIPMYVVSPDAQAIRPAKHQSTLGFITAPSLRSVLAIRARQPVTPKAYGHSADGSKRRQAAAGAASDRLHLIIFIAEDIRPALEMLGKCIKKFLRPDGAAIIVYDGKEGDAHASMASRLPGHKVSVSSDLIQTLFPVESAVVVVSHN